MAELKGDAGSESSQQGQKAKSEANCHSTSTRTSMDSEGRYQSCGDDASSFCEAASTAPKAASDVIADPLAPGLPEASPGTRARISDDGPEINAAKLSTEQQSSSIMYSAASKQQQH